MSARIKPKKAQGPIQFVEGIWGKISNDPGVRGALNKTRNFISNGPFIAIVVGTGGESKPVAFAVVPVLGLAQAGPVIQAIEEATSGRPVSINTVLTALQSLGAVSVPGLVVGTVISGAVNAINLLIKHGNHPVPTITTPDMKMPNTTCSTPEVTQGDTPPVNVQDRQDTQYLEGGPGVENCGLPSTNTSSILPSSNVFEGGILADDGAHITESGQVLPAEEAEPGSYWYEVIDDRSRNPMKSKL
ncbi:hypothetical protein B0J17DRAFT_721563 [Rhizoctonia solani]|nr:hypothetical protein B0J17DRAFT_721563 [Rhizoctonia solani]